MPRRKRTVRRQIRLKDLPSNLVGYPYTLKKKGEEVDWGEIGAVVPRGKGVTFTDRSGEKLCGICEQTARVLQDRANLIVALNDGREVVINDVFDRRRS